MSQRGDAAVLLCVIQRQEIRGVVHRFDSGPVEGYEWRLLVRYPATAQAPSRTEWTQWIFGFKSVESMLAQPRTHVRTQGHLAAGTPPIQRQH